MIPVWPPIAALLLPDLHTPASPDVVRWLLRADAATRLRYVGDRMWPALAHGQEIVLESLADSALPLTGRAVVCITPGTLDVLRVLGADGNLVLLRGDADPEKTMRVRREDVLAGVVLKSATPSRGAIAVRRSFLDLKEAWTSPRANAEEAAAVIREKYDILAPYFPEPDVTEPAGHPVALVGRHAPAGSRVLVAGSGTGPECFRLAKAGWSVLGVDSSPAMVERATRAGTRLGLDVKFALADIRSAAVADGSCSCVLLGGGIYSFLSSTQARVNLLQRAGSWLSSAGVILLSASMARGAYARIVLSVRWLRHGAGPGSWGESCSRWIAPEGIVGRTYLRKFTARMLYREAAAAGLNVVGWDAGHLVLRPGVQRSTAARALNP